MTALRPSAVYWPAVEQVLLDMDGTVLDLAFDNRFWRELVPARYAEKHGVSLDVAQARLEPLFRNQQGTLNWYCLDYWSGVTGLDLVALKREVRHWIAPLEGSADFLRQLRASGRQVWLATNAHRESWTIKLRHTELVELFDRVVCAHDFGAPKEDARFWSRVAAAHPFEAQSALFVDDGLPMLRAARNFGIGQVVAIRRPDTTQPSREVSEFPSVERLGDLLPVG